VPATVLSYAGVPVPEMMQGRDLNSGDTERDEVFLESLTVAEGNPFIEALRTREWKYVRYMQPFGCPYTEEHLDFSNQEPIFEQLFHLNSDPAERINLVGVKEHNEILGQLLERIRIRSFELTAHGREHKKDLSIGMRPADDVHCW